MKTVIATADEDPYMPHRSGAHVSAIAHVGLRLPAHRTRILLETGMACERLPRLVLGRGRRFRKP